jgi:hypothetical protein
VDPDIGPAAGLARGNCNEESDEISRDSRHYDNDLRRVAASTAAGISAGQDVAR